MGVEQVRGVFPFGQPNRPRPMRFPTGAVKALVIGVYPSALHVRWTPPPASGARLISSLAVDVEPTVFWGGVTPSPADELERWKREVGFDPDHHGTVSLGNNGPSGAGLVDDILTPLGLSATEVAFTDAVPWFFVKGDKGSQGEAIAQRFNPFARAAGATEGDLPARPTAKRLVDIAASPERRDNLRQEIVDADAPLVITLGQEALDSVRRVADSGRGTQSKLVPTGYGQVGEVTIGTTTMAWLPLAHPGFIRQSVDAQWVAAFAAWKSALAAAQS